MNHDHIPGWGGHVEETYVSVATTPTRTKLSWSGERCGVRVGRGGLRSWSRVHAIGVADRFRA